MIRGIKQCTDAVSGRLLHHHMEIRKLGRLHRKVARWGKLWDVDLLRLPCLVVGQGSRGAGVSNIGAF